MGQERVKERENSKKRVREQGKERVRTSERVKERESSEGNTRERVKERESNGRNITHRKANSTTRSLTHGKQPHCLTGRCSRQSVATIHQPLKVSCCHGAANIHQLFRKVVAAESSALSHIQPPKDSIMALS